ncbi:hypothetical protein C8F04DRAFT_62205 [Mycena alexandri]|uniref:Uncharacterized protein n=1 Tax=Mycena alexandri TaxID=1745969 RepID=A0AAD6SLP1_9AGAR|nr:hypothetical protein C8F04DRAFT_62205 [Mycena alexandri]
MSGVEFALLAVAAIKISGPLVNKVLGPYMPNTRFEYWQTRATKSLQMWDDLQCKGHVDEETRTEVSAMIAAFETKSLDYKANKKTLNHKARLRAVEVVGQTETAMSDVIVRTSQMAWNKEAYCLKYHRHLRVNEVCPKCDTHVTPSGRSPESGPPTLVVPNPPPVTDLTLADLCLSPGFVSHESTTVFETDGIRREIHTKACRIPSPIEAETFATISEAPRNSAESPRSVPSNEPSS